MDDELREAIINADSLLSLVAYRYPRGRIPEDVLHDMKVTANKLRDFYDTRRDGPQAGKVCDRACCQTSN